MKTLVVLLFVAILVFVGVNAFGSVNQFEYETGLTVDALMLPEMERTVEAVENGYVNPAYAEAVPNYTYMIGTVDLTMDRYFDTMDHTVMVEAMWTDNPTVGVRLKYPLSSGLMAAGSSI